METKEYANETISKHTTPNQIFIINIADRALPLLPTKDNWTQLALIDTIASKWHRRARLGNLESIYCIESDKEFTDSVLNILSRP